MNFTQLWLPAPMIATSEIAECEVRVGRDGRRIDVSAIGTNPASHEQRPAPETEPDEEEPEPSFVEEIEGDEPEESGQMDIEEVPDPPSEAWSEVKSASTVVLLIDPKWDHLSSNIGARPVIFDHTPEEAAEFRQMLKDRAEAVPAV
jgi:hypothetical protein